MLVFNIQDDQGEKIGKDHYDLFLLAGNQYNADHLPKGFFMDRQIKPIRFKGTKPSGEPLENQ